MDIIKAREELLHGKTIYDMKLKVADYGRVSTDKEEQLNSLDNQINFFKEYINTNQNWTHVGSYIDEGISGTSIKKRDNFLKMIKDAKEGKIDLIITKEISRFSRNTIDSIKYTQELLNNGVIVLFLSDNINTIYPDSEFRLTLMASLAQDEVRKLSERVKFGIKRSIKDGKVGGSHLTGYYKKDGKLTINKNEVPIIKTLFTMYSTNDYSFKQISKHLASLGYFTKKGKPYSETTLKKMITNPRYKGYYTANLSKITDYKTHKKTKTPISEQIIYKDNKGNVPAIIDEELWNKANEVLNKRTIHWNKNNLNKENRFKEKTYTSKIFCKEHNKPFIRCNSGTRKEKPVWQCNEYLRKGIKGCKSPIIKEDILNKIFIQQLSNIINIKNINNSLLEQYKKINIKPQSLELNNLYNIKNNLLSLLTRQIITEEEYIKEKNNIDIKIANLKADKQKININNINNYLNNKCSLNDLISDYTNIFIDNILIEKINNNRKLIKLIINYKFAKNNDCVIINL